MKKIRICATIPNLDGIKSWGKIHKEFFETLRNPNLEITIADLPKAKIKSVSNAFDTTLFQRCLLVATLHDFRIRLPQTLISTLNNLHTASKFLRLMSC